MRDEVLRPLDDPGEISDTQLVGFEQRGRQGQARRVGERPGPPGSLPGQIAGEAPLTEPLGRRQVETEEVTVVVGHIDTLTDIDVYG